MINMLSQFFFSMINMLSRVIGTNGEVKRAKKRINLPNETWLEIFDWLIPDRKEVAAKFSELGDFQFSVICQHWLHEHIRNVRLGYLHICSDAPAKQRPTIDNNLVLRCSPDPGNVRWETVPIAQTPLPDNIVDIKTIRISFLNPEALAFLGRLQPLLTKVHLDVQAWDPETRGRLLAGIRHILPLCRGVGGISCHDWTLLSAVRAEFPAQFFRSQVLNTYLEPPFTATAGQLELFCDWLETQRGDQQQQQEAPMLFLAYFPFGPDGEHNFVRMINAAVHRFTRARRPASFFVRLWHSKHNGAGRLEEENKSTLINATTGEQYVVQKQSDGDNYLIARCPSTVDPGWLDEKMAQLLAYNQFEQDTTVQMHSPAVFL